MKNKQKEKIINEFRKRFVDYFEEGSLTYEIEGVDSFLSKALDSIREETLGEAFKAEMNGGGICKVEYKDEPKNKR